MKATRKTLRLACVGLAALAVVLFAVIAGSLKRLGEFGRAENVKGHWAFSFQRCAQRFTAPGFVRACAATLWRVAVVLRKLS